MLLRGLLLLSAVMAVYCYAGDTRGPMNCREKIDATLERQRNGEELPQDMEFPECDAQGDYEIKQCFAQWTGMGGWCRCYKKYSGQKMEHITGAMRRSPYGRAMTCQCVYDQLYTDKDLGCNTETGDYPEMKCLNGKCVCISRTGFPIYGFSAFNEGESNCLCAQVEDDLNRLYAARKSREGLIVNCNKDGSFQPIQQHGSSQYCVDKEGKHVGAFVQVGQPLEC